MPDERSPHSELVERVRQATASDIPPAPWTWDSEWDSLKGADGRYVLCTRLDFHGRDEEGDNFTSHLDLLKGEDLIALAPEMATALVSLFEQLQTAEARVRELERQKADLPWQTDAKARAVERERDGLLEQLEAQGRRLDAVRMERDGLESQRDVAYRQRDEACNEFANLRGLLDEAESLLRKSGGNPGRPAHWHDLHEEWLRRYRAASERGTSAGNDGTVPGTPGLDGCAERQSRPATPRSETASSPAKRPT